MLIGLTLSISSQLDVTPNEGRKNKCQNVTHKDRQKGNTLTHKHKWITGEEGNYSYKTILENELTTRRRKLVNQVTIVGHLWPRERCLC